MDAKGIKMITPSHHLAPADFILFPTVKREFQGIAVDESNITKEWEGACNSIPKDSFTRAYNKWIEHGKKQL